jgi:hypothetical protein
MGAHPVVSEASGSVKTPFPFLLFPQGVPVRSPASYETNPEKDARENGERNQR